MIIVKTLAEMQNISKKLKKEQKTIGFVPTMGFLHEGHKALLQSARKENEIVVLSIFVNPLQFGPNEDLATYPRDFQRDKQVAIEEKVDYLFHPDVDEMYPTAPSVTVKVNKRTDVLCGSARPGHFDGVATVLTKLFHLIQPDKAYFGNKDAQQVAVVEGLVSDFHFPLKIVRIDTVREEDGLAKSSRNVKLSMDERKQATILYRSLSLAERKITEGERDPEEIKLLVKNMINENSDGIIDYIEILSYPELEKLAIIKNTIIIALAVKFKHARLIDNLILTI